MSECQVNGNKSNEFCESYKKLCPPQLITKFYICHCFCHNLNKFFFFFFIQEIFSFLKLFHTIISINKIKNCIDLGWSLHKKETKPKIFLNIKMWAGTRRQRRVIRASDKYWANIGNTFVLLRSIERYNVILVPNPSHI